MTTLTNTTTNTTTNTNTNPSVVRTTALGHELSTMPLLTFLADHHHQQREQQQQQQCMNVGAVVLLDPPSIGSMYFPRDRDAMVARLSRLNRSLSSPSSSSSSSSSPTAAATDSALVSTSTCSSTSTPTRTRANTVRDMEEGYRDELALFQRERAELADPVLRLRRQQRAKWAAMRDGINGFGADPGTGTGTGTGPGTGNDAGAGAGSGRDVGGTAVLDGSVGRVDVLGRAPRQGSAVGAAMLGRILVVSTIPDPDTCARTGESEGEGEAWGHARAAELAALYSAPPPIRLPPLQSQPLPLASQQQSPQPPQPLDEARWHAGVSDVLLDWLRSVSRSPMPSSE